MMRALDASLRLAGIGAQNLDVKFRQTRMIRAAPAARLAGETRLANSA
jgi:hypothetical protein